MNKTDEPVEPFKNVNNRSTPLHLSNFSFCILLFYYVNDPRILKIYCIVGLQPKLLMLITVSLFLVFLDSSNTCKRHLADIKIITTLNIEAMWSIQK